MISFCIKFIDFFLPFGIIAFTVKALLADGYFNIKSFELHSDYVLFLCAVVLSVYLFYLGRKFGFIISRKSECPEQSGMVIETNTTSPNLEACIRRSKHYKVK